MTSVKVKNIVIGEGTPKICVPVMGTTKEEIISEVKNLQNLSVDVVEWRVDYFEHSNDFFAMLTVLQEVRPILGNLPLLFTLRTCAEGGKVTMDTEDYADILLAATLCRYIDLVDVELSMGDETVERVVEAARQSNVAVIASSHDFQKTPSESEIIEKMCKMQDLGADILKVAVMPQNKKDVITLLSATENMATNHAKCPIITMSMDRTGVISRLCGEAFGSTMTFGAAKEASAPGQIAADDLHDILEALHKHL